MADGVEEVWPTVHIIECYSWLLECRLAAGSRL